MDDTQNADWRYKSVLPLQWNKLLLENVLKIILQKVYHFKAVQVGGMLL